MSIDYRERRLRFWCQKVLPLVYDESLSYYELLCKIMKHLSEAETDVSALEQWLADLDAEAVKMVYSEYPLYAVKSGNAVTLKRRSEASAPITDVANRVGISGNPIHATISTQVQTGHLDPNDENSPEGTVMEEATVTLTIDEATSSAKGVMSASDKSKLDALHEVTVVAGSSGNIQVGSATTGYNRRYTVELNPAFKATLINDELMGDNWEWNAMLDGSADCNYTWAAANDQWVIYGPGQPPSTYSAKNARIMKGVCIDTDSWSAQTNTVNFTGFTYGASSGTPFTRVTSATTFAEGEPYYTTLDDIEIKGKFYGTGVANRTVRIYLTGRNGAGEYGNQYATMGDYFFPSSNVKYLPPYVETTTDSDGRFEVVFPAGKQGLCSSETSVQFGDNNAIGLRFTLYGTRSDVISNVKVNSLKISVKTDLHD